MVANVTYLGALVLGLLLVAAGTFLGFAHADADLHMDGDVDADVDTDVDGDADGGAEAHHGGDAGSGLSLFSVAGMGSLLVGFGALGYSVSRLGAGPVLALPAGLVGAWAAFRATAWLRRTLVRNLETGRADGEEDLVYQPATVTIPVPAGGGGRGQVSVHKGMRTFYVTARTEAEQELPVGATVVITALQDGVYLVDPYEGNA